MSQGRFRTGRPGGPIPLGWNQWDRMATATEAVEDQREIWGTDANSPPISNHEMLISNPSSLRRIGRGEILVMDVPLVTTGDTTNFRDEVIFRGREPETQDFGRAAICRDGLEKEDWGTLLVGGAAVARIYALPEHRWMEYLDVQQDDGQDMYTMGAHPSGSWEILYHDLNTRSPQDTNGWAYVRYNGKHERELWGECVTTIPVDGSGTFAPWVQNQTTPGYKTDSPLDCSHSFFSGAGDVTPGQKMRARWFNDLRRWEVTAAEC